MDLTGKENMEGVLPLPRKYVEQQKAHPLSKSSTKIPVLFKSRLPSELKKLQEGCSSAVNGLKTSKVSSAGVPVLKPIAGGLSKSCSREPLGEMQLSASGHRNVLEGGNANSKGAWMVEFVPDADALASILSNTGLSNHVVSATHKTSLARRVPLQGSRACSAISGTSRDSLNVGTAAVNPARMSCLSRSSLKDGDHPQACSLTLNAQQLKVLSTTIGNLGPGVEAKDNQLVENLHTGKSKDSVARPKTECPSNITEATNAKARMPSGNVSPLSNALQDLKKPWRLVRIASWEGDSDLSPPPHSVLKLCIPVYSNSNLAGRTETTGTSWTGEEFVPDPAAKASILLNIGLTHSAIRASSKLSLARRVPVKDVQKPPLSGSIRDENASLPGYGVRASPAAKFGRVSCCSTQGLKGLKESGAFGPQLPITPGNRCSLVDYSLSGQARRVPIVKTPSSRFTPWTCNRILLSSCAAKRLGRCLTKTPQTKFTGGATPRHTGIVSSKKDGSPLGWEKIAVRLFNDGLEASAKKVPAAHIPSDMGKLQRIEFLAQLLQQEVNGSINAMTPSLEELHKLLSVRCSPALEAAKPDLVTTPSQDATPKPGEQAALAPAAPVLDTMHTTASSQPVCSAPSVCSLGPSPSSANSTGVAAVSSSVAHFKQRLQDLLDAPRRFHEDCLNDECAFYTSRITSSTHPSVPRCREPVAKLLDAQDAMHFIPIASPWSPFTEAERSSPL